MSINQAVLFTKPVHHLGIELTPGRLDELVRSYFESRGFSFVLHRSVSGTELASRHVIRQHYMMYSRAACAEEIQVSEDGKLAFEERFGESWDSALAKGRILPTSRLLGSAKISVHQLFNRWSALFAAGKTVKIQDGFVMGWLEDLKLYCINAFYPSMEAHFNHPDTVMNYYVVEFDPEEVSWKKFRKQFLGVTNASAAVPESFRGQLYQEYPVQFPGRDNYVHGSAGPLEGLVERTVHEPGFDMEMNPVGRYLAEQRGVTLASLQAWKDKLSITEMGNLFDQTEEKDTDEVIEILDGVRFS